MTHKQKNAHASLVKQVHISVRYQNYFCQEREEYTQMLLDAFGKNSSVALSVGELITLVDYLNMKSDTLPTFIPKSATSAQVFKMMQLWEQKARDTSSEALLSFCKRIIKKEYEAPKELKFNEAQKVLIALEKMK